MNMERIFANKSIENVFDIEKVLSQLKAEVYEIDSKNSKKYSDSDSVNTSADFYKLSRVN